ncbi:hypothetical protein GIV78_23160, partial [Pseudomonas sp. PA-3-6H]|nr:hypothetical protein [Pseudomonas sp. PA-3-6H]
MRGGLFPEQYRGPCLFQRPGVQRGQDPDHRPVCLAQRQPLRAGQQCADSQFQKGIEEQMKNGVVAGYPLIGLKATVFDGSYHDV